MGNLKFKWKDLVLWENSIINCKTERAEDKIVCRRI